MEELLRRDKPNLDIFCLKDDSLDDMDTLLSPDEIAAWIVDSLEAALEAFQSVAMELRAGSRDDDASAASATEGERKAV